MSWEFENQSQLAAKGMTPELVAQHALKQAREGKPIWDGDTADSYLVVIKEHADEFLTKIETRYLQQVADTKGQLERALNSRNDLNHKKVDADSAVKIAESAFKLRHNQAPPTSLTHALWYWPLMVILLFLEIPINSIVFRIFGESEVFTLLASLTVRVGLVFFAHLLGHMIGDFRHGYKPVKAWAIGATAAVPIVVMLGVAYFRELHLESVVSSQADSAGTIQQIVWNASLGFIFFFGINLLIFLAGIFLSMVSYDPLGDTFRSKKRELKELEDAIRNVDAEIAKCELIIKAVWQPVWGSASSCIQYFQLLQSTYISSNIQNRSDQPKDHKGDPAPFGNFPQSTIRIPDGSALLEKSFMKGMGISQ